VGGLEYIREEPVRARWIRGLVMLGGNVGLEVGAPEVGGETFHEIIPSNTVLGM
jgi:hypothetical protein